MPTFDFTSPEGKTYSVEGPDGATQEQAFQILQQQLGASPKSEGGSIGGVAKSLGTGLAEGVIGLAGIPGDLAALNMKMAGRQASSGMGSEDIKKRVEQYTGEFYKPQGTAEEVASKIGQFAPAVIGGPETLAARVATRAVAPAVASEIGGKVAGPYGEVAGALVGATGATAAARKFQEMAAARQTAKAATPSTENLLKTAGSQFDQARDMNVVVKPDFATNAAADMRQTLRGFDPEAHSVVFKAADRLENLGKAPSQEPVWYQGVWHGAGDKPVSDYWTTDLAKAKEYSGPGGFIFAAKGSAFPESVAKNGNVLSNKQFNPGGPYSIPEIQTLGKLPRTAAENDFTGLLSKPVAMNDVENIRKQLVSLKTSPDASIREAARQAIKSLQKSQMALTPAETLAGDAGAFSSLTKDAVANWAAGKRSNIVMGKSALGELNAATAGSGANEDNALRQAFKQLARPVNNDITPKWQRLGFNKEEGAAIEQAARGTKLGNVARYIGKAAPTGIVSGAMSSGAGHLAGGPIGAVALPAAGYIAKKIGDLSTKRAVAALDSLVRSRSPLAQQVAAQLPPQIVQQLPSKTQRILRSLSLAGPALRQQVGQAESKATAY